MDNLWKNKAECQADRLIDELLKAKVAENSKKQHSITIAVDGNSWVYSFGNTLNFAALCGCAKPDKLDKTTIMEVLSDANGLSKPYHVSFENIYQDLQKKMNKQKRYSWTSYIPLKMELPQDCKFKQITICGITFKLVKGNSIKQKINQSKFDELTRNLSYIQKAKKLEFPRNWLKCETKNINFLQSWQSIAVSFYSFRGLFELAGNGFSFKTSFPFQPRFTLPFPSYVIGVSETGAVDYYYFNKFNDQSKEKPLKVETSVLEWVKENAKLLRKQPKDDSIELLIVNCLRLYSYSVDDVTSKHCLLSLWQMAECLTSSENFGGKTNIVIDRLSWFSRDFKGVNRETLKKALTVVSHNRNEIVHGGRDSDLDEDYINIFQMTCVAGLLWLINNKNRITSVNRLELFYQYYSRNNNDLESTKGVIKLVEDMRNSN